MKTLKVICIMLFGPVLGMGIAFLAAVLFLPSDLCEVPPLRTIVVEKRFSRNKTVVALPQFLIQSAESPYVWRRGNPPTLRQSR